MVLYADNDCEEFTFAELKDVLYTYLFKISFQNILIIEYFLTRNKHLEEDDVTVPAMLPTHSSPVRIHSIAGTNIIFAENRDDLRQDLTELKRFITRDVDDQTHVRRQKVKNI